MFLTCGPGYEASVEGTSMPTTLGREEKQRMMGCLGGAKALCPHRPVSHPQSNDMADNSLDGVECTAHNRSCLSCVYMLTDLSSLAVYHCHVPVILL